MAVSLSFGRLGQGRSNEQTKKAAHAEPPSHITLWMQSRLFVFVVVFIVVVVFERQRDFFLVANDRARVARTRRY